MNHTAWPARVAKDISYRYYFNIEELLAAGYSPDIITVEEHNITGGFGSAVCEVTAESGSACRVHRMGLQDCFTTVVGDQAYLRKIYGMDAEAIVKKAEDIIGKH